MLQNFVFKRTFKLYGFISWFPPFSLLEFLNGGPKIFYKINWRSRTTPWEIGDAFHYWFRTDVSGLRNGLMFHVPGFYVFSCKTYYKNLCYFTSLKVDWCISYKCFLITCKFQDGASKSLQVFSPYIWMSYRSIVYEIVIRDSWLMRVNTFWLATLFQRTTTSG